jgi:hypothetical protein
MEKKMKKWIMSIAAAALFATPSFAQIKVTDNLSVTGFFDMSTTYNTGSKTNTLSFDQFEIDFMYEYGMFTGQADFNSLGGGSVDLEQAFVTYTSPGGFSLTGGKFLSCSGWETAEPTGLYQYSYSATLVYGGYQNGVAASFGNDKVGFYGAVVSSVWNGADTSMDDMGFEAQISFMPAEGITAKVAYLWEDMGAFNQSLINAWGMYAKGPITLAAEYNHLLDWGAKGNNGYGWILMGNMCLSDKVAATVRYSGLDTDTTTKFTEITFSPSYVVSDNVGMLAEIRRDIDAKVTSFAFETILSF